MRSLLVSEDLVEGLPFPSEDRGEDQTSSEIGVSFLSVFDD